MERASIKRQALLEIALVGAGAAGIAFGAIVLTTPFREFTHAGLEGRYFGRYYGLFLPIFWVLLMIMLIRIAYQKKIDRLLWWMLSGILAGYLSGVISTIFVDLFDPGGWELVGRRSLHINDWVLRISYPVIALNWLVGVVAGTLGFFAYRAWSGKESQSDGQHSGLQ